MDEESIPGIQKEYEITKEFLPGISLDEINRLGQEFVSDNNIVAMVTAQEKEGVSVPSEAKVLEIIKSVKGMKIDPYTEKLSDAPLLAAVPVGTAVSKRKENVASGYTDLTFGNGVRVILKPTDFKNDEILLTAYSPGGISLYPVADVMSATLAPTIVSQSGLGDFDLIGLQKKLSGNTAKLSPYINELREGVNGNCSPKDLETLLQLNYLYFTGTRKDESAFNAYVSRIRNMIKPMRSTPQIIFQDTLSKIISMNSPRVIAVPTDAQIDQVKLDRSLSIFRERFADASDFTYIMVGNFKVDEVMPLLEKYIGGLPSIKRKETWKDVSPGFPEGKVVVEVPKNSEPQSTVAMIWKDDFKWKIEERQAFSMLMQILNIKARESMREDQGGVYGVGINGNASPYPKPEYTIQASWGCNPENIGKLASTVIAVMDTLKMQGPTVTDLNKVRETMIRERETRLKENSFWLSVLQNHLMYGDKLRTLDEYKTFINGFTGADIKAVANKYLDKDEYVQVSLTPASGVQKK
jgi:zinc protease